MKIFFLILAYNEEEFLQKTILKLQKIINELNIENYETYVLNDGSTDKTHDAFLKCKSEINNKLKIITNIKNLGVAKSIQNFIKSKDSGKLIVLSGDNDQHENLVKKLIIASLKCDFVLTYYINREIKGYLRASISYFFNFFLCTLFGVYAFYLQGPFVWPIETVKKFNSKNIGVTYISEVNIKLLRSGLKFIEISGISLTGSYKSTAVSFKNILRSIQTVLHLIYEIHVKKKFKSLSIRSLDID